MRKILITNDDGICSEGIVCLAKAAQRFGEVYVVAPETQRSAFSHSITLHRHIDIYPHDFPVDGVHAFSCGGTPADCVRIGHRFVIPGGADVVLSGINHGYNMATDIQYSATAGAAFEASFQGIIGIAVSEGTGGCHEVRDRYLSGILEEFIDYDPGFGKIVNVNLPDCTLEECRGILYDRKVSVCSPFIDDYVEKEKLPEGGIRIVIDGKTGTEAEEGSDFRAILDRYVSIGIANNIS